MSLLEQYIADKPDRDEGESYAQHRLASFFRMIVTRNKYRLNLANIVCVHYRNRIIYQGGYGSMQKKRR